MKKEKKFTLRQETDIKVFLLYLLDHISYPIDYKTLSEIIAENTDEIIIDYSECLDGLVDRGHLLFDEIDGEKYYMISETGRELAAMLYDRLDAQFLEKVQKYIAKYMSLYRSGARVKTGITENGNRFTVSMEISNSSGHLISTSLTVSSRTEAEKIKKNFDEKPGGVYRGILFSATGRLEYLS